MFKILNRKLNYYKTNSCKRKYHAYLKSADFWNTQSKQIDYALNYIGNNGNMNIALSIVFDLCISNNMKALRAYNLLEKLDKNHKILKSDYDDDVLQYIENDKKFKFTTQEIYAKFDKFKITNEINE